MLNKLKNIYTIALFIIGIGTIYLFIMTWCGVVF